MKDFSVVVLAAGDGTRFGAAKTGLIFNGKPLWKYVFDTARVVSHDVVVVGIGLQGGSRRRDSVLIGLEHTFFDRVVILEAARPLVTSDQIKMIAGVYHPSVSYYCDPVDTIVYSGLTLPRDECHCLQLPQAFDRDMLITAHRDISDDVTSDTTLMWYKYHVMPRLIKGGINLFKVTYPWDLDILRVIDRWIN